MDRKRISVLLEVPDWSPESIDLWLRSTVKNTGDKVTVLEIHYEDLLSVEDE